jgi:hypothetical protein
LSSQAVGRRPAATRSLIERSLSSFVLPAVVLGLIADAAGLIFYGMSHWSYDVWGALILVPVLLGLNAPLIAAAARQESDPRMPRILVAAFVLKLAGSVANYVIFTGAYGVADSKAYSAAGKVLAQGFRHGQFGPWPGKIPGTGFVDVVTGVVYTFIGPTFIGGYLVFSLFGFWGIYFFYRGVVAAVPAVDSTRYAKLVFFLPSIVFWSSSLSKDSWMALGIGVTMWGFGRMVARLRNGFLVLLLGLGITVSTRPNVTAILFAAIFVGYLARPADPRAGPLAPLYKLAGIAVMVVGGLVVIAQAKSFFNVDQLSVTSVQNVIDSASRHSTEGGSAFQSSGAGSLAHLPQALATVVYRPFPWEAHNIQMLISAAEGAFLMALTVVSWRRWKTLRKRIRNPFVAACVVYTLEFVYAFSAFGNFGILVRERVQLFPFLLVLLCLRPERRQAPADRIELPSSVRLPAGV